MTCNYRRRKKNTDNFTIILNISPSTLQISEIIFKTSLHQGHPEWILTVIDLDKYNNSGQNERRKYEHNKSEKTKTKKEQPNLVFNKHDCCFPVQGLRLEGRLQRWAGHTWTRICNLMRRKEGVNPLSLSESVKVLQRNSTYRPDGLCVCVCVCVCARARMCPQRETFILIGSHDHGGLQGKPAGWRPKDELSP